MGFKLLASLVLSALCFVAAGIAQERSPSGPSSGPQIGLAVGAKAPSFSLRDQSGRVQTSAALKGAKGTVVLFFRSADWCPYCKAQLIDLQKARARFEQEGLKLAAISYDTVEILQAFADRRQIEFPMLADPDSQVIRAYGVLNAEAQVYAPGAQGYRVTELKIQPSPDFALASSAYPNSKSLYLAAIKETVPVYEGSFRITQDVAFSFSPAFLGSLGAGGKTVEVQGEFRYQACDARICYLPESVPVKWQVQVMPLDRQRAPEAIQHK